MDRITVPGYGETHLDAAHVIAESAHDGGLEIVAFVREPLERAFHAQIPGWDEGAFRHDVREAINEAGWDEPDPGTTRRVWLQWDPGRDDAEDELFAEAGR